VLLKTLDNDNKWHEKSLTIGGNALADRLICWKGIGMHSVCADRLESGCSD